MSLMMSFQECGRKTHAKPLLRGYSQKASDALNLFKATGLAIFLGLQWEAATHLSSESAERSLQQIHNLNKRQ